MKSKITLELDASKSYDLRCTKFEGLVDLTRDNVARVECMIRNDSDYSDSGKKEEHAKYWFKELKKYLFPKETSNFSYEEVIRKCVKYVDSENSTHINADKVGRDELSQRIITLQPKTLLQYLLTPSKDFELITILSESTHPHDSKYHARKNYSFATKFCHYACLYMFEGMEEQDNFSIYDSIVAQHISEYAAKYKVQCPKSISSNYYDFINVVDGILHASGNQISRYGFDHLLWYYHKAR